MSVKIKDLRMPESCCRCPMSVSTPCYGELRCFVTDCNVNNPDYYYERHPECPLEEMEEE